MNRLHKKGIFTLLRFLNEFDLSLVLILNWEITDGELGNNSYEILKFWSILSMGILIKSILIKKRCKRLRFYILYQESYKNISGSFLDSFYESRGSCSRKIRCTCFVSLSITYITTQFSDLIKCSSASALNPFSFISNTFISNTMLILAYFETRISENDEIWTIRRIFSPTAVDKNAVFFLTHDIVLKFSRKMQN